MIVNIHVDTAHHIDKYTILNNKVIFGQFGFFDGIKELLVNYKEPIPVGKGDYIFVFSFFFDDKGKTPNLSFQDFENKEKLICTICVTGYLH